MRYPQSRPSRSRPSAALLGDGGKSFRRMVKRSLTWAEVWRRRLARHGLLVAAERERLAEVASEVCGIHAQVMTSAVLSLGLRVQNITQRDVGAALWTEKTLFKTYGVRGTLHLFNSAELGMWLAALRAKIPPRPPTGAEAQALSPAQRAQIIEAMRAALDGQCLTRNELQQEIVERVGQWAAEGVWPAFGGAMARWALALEPAAQSGVLCFGPPRGNRVTYVRLDQWLEPPKAVDGQEALVTVCRRFLDAYGPATPAEFARWFATTPAAARTLFDALNGELEEADVEGWHAWLPKPTTALQAAQHPAECSALLLPQFDCYVVGCHPRNRLVPGSAPAALRQGTAAPFAVLMVDGVVAGLWQRRRAGKVLRVQVDPFSQLSTQERTMLEAQAVRIGEILGLRGELAFGPVEARRHL